MYGEIPWTGKREGARGDVGVGVNAACSRKIAALAVAMEMEGCPWPWGGVVVS